VAPHPRQAGGRGPGQPVPRRARRGTGPPRRHVHAPGRAGAGRRRAGPAPGRRRAPPPPAAPARGAAEEEEDAGDEGGEGEGGGGGGQLLAECGFDWQVISLLLDAGAYG